MRAAHFDPFSGASGDMVLGALADAHRDTLSLVMELEGALREALPFDLAVRGERVTRHGLAGTRVEVSATDAGPGGKGSPHRRLKDLLDIVARAELPSRVCERAERTFVKLAEAEAAVHGTGVEEVHFHEVGAADTLVDVIGAHWLLDKLGVERVTSGPVAVGSGTVECAHGVLPAPAPASAKLLEGVPVAGGAGEGELTTPTGAALLVTLAEAFGPVPPMKLERVGYGFGSREGRGLPNALRVFLGEAELVAGAPPAEGGQSLKGGGEEEVVILETTVDDMPGEWIGHLHEVLARAGALEVSTTPVGMKKSRPGVRVTVVARVEDARTLAECVLRETTTFGVRMRTERRLVLERETVSVETPWGKVRVKLGRLAGDVIQTSPEYEDCARLAESAGVPLKAVYGAAVGACRSVTKEARETGTGA